MILADIEKLPVDFDDSKKTSDNLQGLMTQYSELDVENASAEFVKAEIQIRHAEMEETMQLCVESFNQIVDEYNSLEQRKAVHTKNVAAFEERAVVLERLCDLKYAETERECKLEWKFSLWFRNKILTYLIPGLNKVETVNEMELEKTANNQFLKDKKAECDSLKKRVQIAKKKRANMDKNRQRKVVLEESIKCKQQELMKMEPIKADKNKLQWEKEMEVRDKKAKTNCLIQEADNLTKSNEDDLKKIEEDERKNAENKMKLKIVAQQKLNQLLQKLDQENLQVARNLAGLIQDTKKYELDVIESRARLDAVLIKDSELEKRMQAMIAEFDRLDSEIAETSIDDSEVPNAAEIDQLIAENEQLKRDKIQMDQTIEATKASYDAKVIAEKQRNERLKATAKSHKNVDTDKLHLSTDFGLTDSEQPKVMEKMKLPSPAKSKQQPKKKNTKSKKSQKWGHSAFLTNSSFYNNFSF